MHAALRLKFFPSDPLTAQWWMAERNDGAYLDGDLHQSDSYMRLVRLSPEDLPAAAPAMAVFFARWLLVCRSWDLQGMTVGTYISLISILESLIEQILQDTTSIARDQLSIVYACLLMLIIIVIAVAFGFPILAVRFPSRSSATGGAKFFQGTMDIFRAVDIQTAFENAGRPPPIWLESLELPPIRTQWHRLYRGVS